MSKSEEKESAPPPATPLSDEKDESPSTTPTLREDHNEVPEALGINPLEEVVTGDGTGYVTGWKLAGLMIAVTIGAFLMLLDMSIIVTAIPKITTSIGLIQHIGWYGSSYNLASAALQPLTGKFYTYFKSRWTFLTFLFIFEIGSLICGVAQSSIMLIIGRTIAGLGSSGIQNGAFTMIAASVPLEKRPSLVGVLMAGAQLGLVIGPLVGGALTEYTTWRWCFYINLPIGAVAAILIVLVHVPDKRVHSDLSAFKIITTKLDLTGFLLFGPCTVMFLLALQWGGVDYPWKSATIIGLFCGGGGLLVLFIWWEHRVGDGAMIPLPVIRKRQVWTACLTMLFLFTTVFVASYYLPIYFQSVKGVSPFTSGVNMLPGILSQMPAAIISGFIVQKVGYYLPFATASGVLLAVGNGLISTFSPHTSTAKWAGYQILHGFARGMGMQMPLIAIQANTAPEMTSIATAILVFSQTFGGAVFVAAANVIFSNELKKELVARIPHISADAIINAGATGIQSVVPEGDLPGALAAYAKGVDATFYLAAASSVCMVLTSFGIGWKDIRKKAPAKAGDA